MKTRKATLAVLFLLLATAASVFLPATFPPQARRMTFIFVLSALFWAFEIIPLHGTALLVVVLEILILGPWAPPGKSVSYEVFLAPLASPVIILFLGGFMLAAALRKFGVDQVLAHHLIAAFGRRPFRMMFGFMATTAFFALWMSGTATAAMMFAMIGPLLVQLDEDDLFRKALVLAIPFGARVGALGTPVGTPPNAIAVGVLQERGIEVSFSSWMMMGLPLALVILAVSAAVLYFMFPAKRATIDFKLPENRILTARGKLTIAIGLGMALLWLTSSLHGIPDALVALIGVTLFVGLGLLDRDDLKRIDWDILILMWGGLALGEGIQVSGLAERVVGLPLFTGGGPYTLAVFCLLAMFVSTFMSNTTSANLLIPLAASFPSASPLVLPIAVALACSFDIPLPISSPPNALAFATKAITVRDMLKAGTPIAIAAIALIIFGSRHAIRFAFG